MQDWLILLLLVMIEGTLLAIHPFHRFVGKDMMEDLKYPMKENTVPIWAVPVSFFPYSLIKPCFIAFLMVIISTKRAKRA